MKSIQNEEAARELRALTGRVVAPTIVIDGQVFEGVSLNREKIEALIARAGGTDG